MSGNTFTCWKCRETYPKGWSDEESLAEYKQLYPDNPPEEPTNLLCDNCNNQFLEHMERTYGPPPWPRRP